VARSAGPRRRWSSVAASRSRRRCPAPSATHRQMA
jgi:hypothetical protein